MTWPTSPVSTTNLDAGTDSPAAARSDLKTAVDNVNAIAAEFGDVATTGKATDDVLSWDGAKWAPDSLATVARSGSYDDLTDQPAAYTLPTASTDTLGGVKVDGTTITIDGSGVISSTGGGGGGGGAIAVFNLHRSSLWSVGGTWTNIGSYFTQNYNGTDITYSAGVFSVPAGTWLLEFSGVEAHLSGGSQPVDNTDFRLQNTTANTTLFFNTTKPTGNDSSENYGLFHVCRVFTLAATSNVEFQFISNENARIRAEYVGVKFTKLA